jgi:hypothetical protein
LRAIDARTRPGGERTNKLRHTDVEAKTWARGNQSDKKDITFASSRGAKFEDKFGLLQGVGKVSKHSKSMTPRMRPKQH